MARLNIALIGAGRIGRLHAENLSYRVPRANLMAVVDVREVAARQVAEQLGVPLAAGDYRPILEDKTVDAVVIATATDTHARMIEEAAQAGKQIFCEKPIDLDLARIDRALTAVERAGVLFQVGFNRRFDAHYSRVRRAVAEGEIGEPHLLHIISRDPAPPPLDYVKVSGGLFLDMTIHDFDMARFLMGSEVEEVYAMGGVRVDPAIGAAGDIDTALVALRFANGVLGTIDNSRQAVYGYDQRVEVFGSGGAVATANVHSNEAIIMGRERIYRDQPHYFFVERYAESYVAEMRAFVDAVLTGGPSPVPGEAGRVAVELAQAAQRSLEQKRPVRLLPDPHRAGDGQTV